MTAAMLIAAATATPAMTEAFRSLSALTGFAELSTAVVLLLVVVDLDADLVVEDGTAEGLPVEPGVVKTGSAVLPLDKDDVVDSEGKLISVH